MPRDSRAKFLKWFNSLSPRQGQVEEQELPQLELSRHVPPRNICCNKGLTACFINQMKISTGLVHSSVCSQAYGFGNIGIRDEPSDHLLYNADTDRLHGELLDHNSSCKRASANAGYVFRSGMLSEWLENERDSMRFLNHLLCRPLRDLWTEDPPELKKRAGAARWRPTIRSALPCPALPCPALPCPALPCPALPCPAWPSCIQRHNL